MSDPKGDPKGPPDKISIESQPVYDFNNKYQNSDKGPYFVYLEHVDKNLGRLFPIKVGYFLKESLEFKNDIVYIKFIGIKRVRVEFKSYHIANSLVNHNLIKSNSLIAFLPKFFTQTKGVIRMVDTFFSEFFLKTEIESDRPVVEVKRMKRWVIDPVSKQVSYVDRQMIIVTFLGNKIPDTVKMYLVRFNVESYVHPVVQCFKCLRYGHTHTQCKSKKRCQTCANQHEEDEENKKCELEKYCIYCNTSDHSSIPRNCPDYIKQYNIKKTMAYQNTTFKEAQFLIENPTYAKISTNNRFDILKNDENFPELPSTGLNNFLLRKPKINHATDRNNSKLSKKRKCISPPISPTCNTSESTYTRNSSQISSYNFNKDHSNMTHISASPSTSPKDNSSFNPNQIITQITSFIYEVIQKPESINELTSKTICVQY